VSHPIGILGGMDRIIELAERQHSLIGREQALAHGMTIRQIEGRLRAGRWRIAARAVYAVAGSVQTWEQRLLAAVLSAGLGAAASRRSAAALWRLPGFSPGPIEVTQGRALSVRTPATRVHDSNLLPPHQVRMVNGIPVVSVERTVLDLCGSEHPKRAERALDNALAMEVTTIQKLGLMLAETGRRGRPGTALTRQLLAVRTADYIPPASALEALVVAVLEANGIEQPVRQDRVGGTSAPIGRVDFVFRAARLVVEADSRRHHGSWLDVEADHRRDLLLAGAGWSIVRVNWHQLVQEPELFVAAVRAHLRRAAA
jgi:very-short-patch-repair endonuclease